MAGTSTKAAVNLPNKWKLEVCSTKGGWRPPSYPCDPPGYVPQATGGGGGGGALAHHSAGGVVAAGGGDVATGSRSESAQQQLHLLSKRAWDVALAPLKSLPMNMFVMYMSGNSISIFPIMMVCMMTWRPLKAIFAVNQAFRGFEDQVASIILQKLVYTLGNALAIALAVYKCHGIGLLPTHASDWLDFVQPPERMEYVAAAAPYL